jgi:hypothetical protein
MRFSDIRQRNMVAAILLVAGLIVLLGGLAVGFAFDSEVLVVVLLSIGGAALASSILLSFVIDRVRCPECGKLFNRPDHRNWFARNFSMTQPHSSCVHCGHGSKEG